MADMTDRHETKREDNNNNNNKQTKTNDAKKDKTEPTDLRTMKMTACRGTRLRVAGEGQLASHFQVHLRQMVLELLEMSGGRRLEHFPLHFGQLPEHLTQHRDGRGVFAVVQFGLHRLFHGQDFGHALRKVFRKRRRRRHLAIAIAIAMGRGAL